ncbi:hypothetical protein BX661DRAFT_201774 [Kickxella alabastrina]|uniref:uncharacterized protein n=1 Tax=Kickxella alabastrina TaxID=61397 RepID=UPI00221F0F6F|nr:uncharacterized protein BX661DRAFT_201774 [Kickxella alabastrina]KAI7818747.1 hypothetical protein BX661DRAFT_201774 [Kickxella alabastrina]
MVNKLQVYPAPINGILEKLEIHVDAHYQDKKLDLGMRCGWKELTEYRYTTLSGQNTPKPGNASSTTPTSKSDTTAKTFPSSSSSKRSGCKSVAI